MLRRSIVAGSIALFLIYGCSRRHHPAKTPETVDISINKKTDSVAKKKVFTPKKKDIIPKVIVVNDNAAHKAIDGRLYYDLLGHRYWKNFKDGKYYLFSQSMYNNDDFKAPK